MKKIEKIEGTLTDIPKSTDLHKHSEIKADYPLIEKDEVKEAEAKMRKAAKKEK